LGYISRARNLWRFVVDTTRRVCMRALNTTASTFPDALRSQKKRKMNLEMHALRAKHRDRLHDANAQSRDPPVYTVASRVDRASFYAVWPCVGRVIRVAKGDHRDPLCRKNICTW
jgi:hypothetical protein